MHIGYTLFMKVVVGSQNTPKINAVKSVFVRYFPDLEIEFLGEKVDSGVSSHPTSAEESIQGAKNRADNAESAQPGADYYVGIEGGLLEIGDKAWEIGWVVIRNKDGIYATGMGSGIEMGSTILQAIKEGRELDLVLEDMGIGRLGNANGFYGLATNNIVTRQDALSQSVAFALAHFIHPELFS